MGKVNQLLAFCTGIGILGGSLCFSVQAEAKKKIVVIGDSISSGEGLSEQEKSYVDWIAYDCPYVEIQNFARDHATTEEILQSLSSPEIQEALSQADLIFVTAGMEDIMQPFFQKADEYMQEFGFVQFTDVFTASLQEHGIQSEDELIVYSNNLSAAARSQQEQASVNMQKITEILSQYQNAQVIYQTVYNPLNTIENLDSLSSKRKVAYNSVCNPITSIMQKSYNEPLSALGGNSQTADIFTAFQGLAYQYVNLNELNSNPNAEGHKLIAEFVMEKAGLERQERPETTTTTTTTTTSTTTTTTTATTKPTTSTTTTTTTATTKPTTSTTTTETTSITTESFAFGDINHDSAIDAGDAAVILEYAAKAGSGEVKLSFQEYMIQNYDWK